MDAYGYTTYASTPNTAYAGLLALFSGIYLMIIFQGRRSWLGKSHSVLQSLSFI